MKRESKFKFVFWGLLVVFILLWAAVSVVGYYDNQESEQLIFVLIMSVTFICILVYIFFVGRFIYRDAEKRGLDAWMWATIGAFIPHFVGLIIYLVMRQPQKTSCVKCGKGIKDDFKLCPYCGQNHDLSCNNCKKKVSVDWIACPYCSHSLTGEKE